MTAGTPPTTQNPSPAEAWFCDQVAAAESLQLYVPLITSGGSREKLTRQTALGAPPCRAEPVAFQNPIDPSPPSAVLVPMSPTNPAATAPLPLFQW